MKKMKFHLSFFIATLFAFARNGFCEIFTAIVHMEKLLKTEEILIETLEKYIGQTENKLMNLKCYFGEFSKDHRLKVQEKLDHVLNPVNAFRLTKRLTKDWKTIESIMVRDAGKELLKTVKDYKTNNSDWFPTEEDLNGASVAITRLQRVYNLNPWNLAKGEINGVMAATQFSSSDCFELGRQCFKNDDFYNAELWMREALMKHYTEVNKTANKIDILTHLSSSAFMMGDFERALTINNKLLKVCPRHEEGIKKKILIKNALLQLNELKNKRNKDDEVLVFSENEYLKSFKRNLKYERLCRDEIGVSEKIKATLKCRYVDFGRPFLKLAKVKEEEAFLNPRIVLYHDVLYDEEIKTIKQLSLERLNRATAFNSRTKTYEPVDYRISKTAWLEDSLHPRVATVSQRVQDITGLNMATAELLQVVNYGIGGQYEPHYDFSFEPLKDERGIGRRLSTFLFYMSDVPQGGATIFPSLNVAVKPKKGSAVFWYNINKNGKGDPFMRHASCPVLVGSKWICNKWIHERGQEFIYPCGLTEDDF